MRFIIPVFAFCFNEVAAVKMKITPEFLLLLPPGLCWVLNLLQQNLCWRWLKKLKNEGSWPQSNSLFYPYSPLQTLIQFLSQPFCVMRPGLELSILICVKSLSLGTYLFYLILLCSLFLLFPWSLCLPGFCTVIFFPCCSLW